MSTTPPESDIRPPDAGGGVLARSDEGRMLTGVCAGLGRYAGIDPVLVRVGFAVLILGSGIGIFLYVAAFLLMRHPGGAPGYVEQWTNRVFDSQAVLALLTAVLGFGLVMNVFADTTGPGTIVVGTMIAIALLAARSRGVDLVAIARSLPERLSHRLGRGYGSRHAPYPSYDPAAFGPPYRETMARAAGPAPATEPPATEPSAASRATEPPAAEPRATGEAGPYPVGGEPPVTARHAAQPGPATDARPGAEPAAEPRTAEPGAAEPPAQEPPLAEPRVAARPDTPPEPVAAEAPADRPLPSGPPAHEPPPAPPGPYAAPTAAAGTGPATAGPPPGATDQTTVLPNVPHATAPSGDDGYRRLSDLAREARTSAYGSQEPFAPRGPYNSRGRYAEDDQPGYDPTGYGYDHGGYLDRPYGADVHGAPVATPARKRPRSYVGLVTIFLAMLVGGIMVASQPSGSAVNIPLAGGAVLITIGAGLLVAAWFGRGAGLIAAGTIVSLVLIAGGTLDGVPKRVGSYTWAPATTSAALAGRYEVGIGDAVLNLTETEAAPGSRTRLEVTIAVGSVEVIVPRTARVEVDATVRVGDITVGSAMRSGTGLSLRTVLDSEETTASAPVYELRVKGGLGDVEVRHG